MPDEVEYYAVFEGGGAKGIAYAAALASAEEVGLRFSGVAGASAGAIFASLVAFGYRSADIFDPERPTRNVLATVAGATPVDLLGGDRKFESFLAASRHFAAAAALPGVLRWLALLGAGLRHGRMLARAAAGLGLFDTRRLRKILNEAYRLRLMAFYGQAGVAPPAKDFADPRVCVTFADLEAALRASAATAVNAGFCDLKVVVTDVTRRRLVLCDRRTHGEVAVSEAVAASASIPLFFRPARRPKDPTFARQWNLPEFPGTGRSLRRLEDPDQRTPSLFADGGLVSNWPIWAFEEERQLTAGGARVIAFSLVDSEPTPEALAARREADSRIAGYLAAVARTAIFGGQTVANQFVSRVSIVPVPTDLGVIEFGLSFDKAVATYARARGATRAILWRELVYRPKVARAALERVRDTAIAWIEGFAGAGEWSAGGARADVRIAVATPLADTALRILPGNTLGLDGSGADDFVFPNDAAGFGDAFASGELVVTNTLTIYKDRRTNPYVGARLAALDAGLIAIPIGEEGQKPQVVIGVFFPRGLEEAVYARSEDSQSIAALRVACYAWLQVERSVAELAPPTGSG